MHVIYVILNIYLEYLEERKIAGDNLMTGSKNFFVWLDQKDNEKLKKASDIVGFQEKFHCQRAFIFAKIFKYEYAYIDENYMVSSLFTLTTF